MQVSFTKSYAAAKYARLLIFAPEPSAKPGSRHSRFSTYASTLDDVRSGICNAALPRVGQAPHEDENYAESVAPMSPDKNAASGRHSR
jgi:hypothetical protein